MKLDMLFFLGVFYSTFGTLLAGAWLATQEAWNLYGLRLGDAPRGRRASRHPPSPTTALLPRPTGGRRSRDATDAVLVWAP